MTAITGLRRRRVDLASCWSSTGCHPARSTAPCGHQRKPATATLSDRPNHQSQLLLPACRVIARAPRIAFLRTHLPRQPNPHNRGRGASAYHRPRVRSLAAFGRRPPCTWLRRSWPASETLHKLGPRALSAQCPHHPQKRPCSRHGLGTGGQSPLRGRSSVDLTAIIRVNSRYIVALQLPVDATDLGAFERQIVHQPFLIEDKSDNRTADADGVDLPASPNRDDEDRSVDADLPAVAALEIGESRFGHEHNDHGSRCAPY